MSASSWPEAVPAAVAAEAADAPRWNVATRVAFRFFFVFFLAMNFPSPLEFVPFLASGVFSFWQTVVPVVAQNVFNVSADTLPNGSGDTTFNYVQLFIAASASALIALVWSLVDRKALSYPRLYWFLRVYVRFTLAFAMIGYGAFKVIKSQFPAPTADRLLQPLGEFSPMGLLWTFMGVSVAYNIFTGLGEMIGGLLLTTRRTALLGGLVSAGVMAHVVMLNYAYDVPVKIFSSLLFVMALFVIAPDAKRLAQFFLQQREKHGRKWVIALRTAIVIGITALSLNQANQQRKMSADTLKPTAVSGVWNVEQLTIDGVERAPLITDAKRWRRVAFAGPRFFSLQRMDSERSRYMMNLREAKNEVELQKRDSNEKYVLKYQKADANTLLLEGTLEKEKIRATLKRVEDKSFLLTSRGFHWINETPLNR